ncbi:MAG: tol-pal system protein YbgF [Burkholderiaceae bacterium]
MINTLPVITFTQQLRAAVIALLIAPMALLIVPSTAYALFDDNEARRAILDLRKRVDVLESDISNQLRSLEGRINSLQATAGGQLTLQQEIEVLRGELARLRGQVEEQGNDLAKTRREQRDQFAKVDSRIKTVEPVEVTINGQAVLVDRKEQAAFDSALNQFRAGNFEVAERSFEQFDVLFPDSPYTVESMFWLGSSQYALRKYKEAAKTQGQLVDTYTDNPRAADALLNKGFAEIELGNKEAAKRSFELVQQRYPGTTAAQSAAQRISGL